MNICIIEDHQLIAESLKNLILSDNEAYEIKLFNSAELFLAEDFDKWLPQIILLDIGLPGIGGLELIDLVREKGIPGKFILLTTTKDLKIVKFALSKNIKGYLTKDISKDELIEAIKKVSEGGRYVNKALKERIVESQFEAEEENFELSRREKEVLNKICEGKSYKEVASEMQLSLHTIHHYVKNLMAKLKINRSTELVLFAIKHELYIPQNKLPYLLPLYLLNRKMATNNSSSFSRSYC